MAYACPVCDEPQVDAEHLANHVAFTAITGDAAHEEWLDSTVGEWGSLGQAELAEIIVEHAEETEFPVDLDDADVGSGPHDHSGGHDHGIGHDHDHDGGVPATSMPAGDLDDDATDVLTEARELTRRMQDGDDDAGADGEGDGSTDGTASDSSDSETQ